MLIKNFVRYDSYYCSAIRVISDYSSRGYTLIELLLVISIMAILITVGVLNFSNYQTRHDVDLGVQTIATALRDAQSRALTGEGNANWGLRVENAPIRLTRFQFAGDCAFTAAEGITMTLKSTIAIVSPGTPPIICFQKITGVSMGGHVTIQVSRLGDSTIVQTITVDANGRIFY